MRSLRSRLLLYGALVATASLAVLIAVLSRGVRLEIDTRTELRSGPGGSRAEATRLAESLAAELGRSPRTRWSGLLDDAARNAKASILLLRESDDGPQVSAIAPPESPLPELSASADGFTLRRRGRDGAVEEEYRFRGPFAAVLGESGERVARLLVVPGPRPRQSISERPPLFVALRRWLAIAAAASIAVAFILGAWLARRISRPIEALTAVVERLRAQQRGSGPEVGVELADIRETSRTEEIDEIAALSRAFDELVEELARSEMARQRMVADVAHELRTPLARLRVQLEALEDGVVEPSAARSAALLADVGLLSRLVADLQDLSLADARRLELRLVDVSFGALVERTLARYETPAREAGIRLRSFSSAHVAGRADPDRVEQILGNLLDNALAWTPRGGEIAVSCSAESGYAVLEVTDTGKGIEPGDQPHVFARFYRADPSRVRDGRGGSGLGLAIVQALVDAHGGDVSVTSQPGLGARFTVRLPALTGS